MPQGYNDVSMVTGEVYSNAPIGSFTYTGTQTSTSSKSIAPGAIGSFSMTADFSNETFQYSGSSGSVNVSGGGVLDVQNGRFATSGLAITDNVNSMSGTMHGLLHGSGAAHTTGIFHSSGSSPSYTGAFVGSK